MRKYNNTYGIETDKENFAYLQILQIFSYC